ncbi:MAG: P1 family peptidase [Sutterella sp.]|nr:P1 family peptidase [Sutterella sp.]
MRVRDCGLRIGVFESGPHNALTDVSGVLVGHVTLSDDGKGMHTGVTAIRPHPGNLFQEKVPAGFFIANAFGKMTGYPQILELGNLETPIVLTNTLSVAAGLDGLIDWTFSYPENAGVRSVNAFVGETNDGGFNDIRARFVRPEHVRAALEGASAGPVAEGCVGAGTGTKAFGFKAGIGTSSRVLPSAAGGWPWQKAVESADGSAVIIVATDAPLDSRNLERLAKRAFMGLARTGGVGSNGSGDFVLAFSTAPENRIAHDAPALSCPTFRTVRNDDMTPLFMEAIEAAEEAILNSLFAAMPVRTFDGSVAEPVPLETVLAMLREEGKTP